MRLAKSSLAALIFGFAPHALVQELGAAREFVAELRGADRRKGPDDLWRDANLAFSQQLLRQIRRATAVTPADDVGALDGDPICDRQDAGAVALTDLKISGGTQGLANATVRLRFPGGFRCLRLYLIAVDRHWRTGDIHTRDTPSLVAYLTQSQRKRH